jgi:myo-inositol-1-phosphate synthase
MTSDSVSKRINVAIVGLGNCAASFIEGLCFYRQYPDIDTGLLFPVLCGYSVQNIEVVTAFDISLAKVGLPVSEAIYQPPNNFVRIKNLHVDGRARVFRGPTLDGNPEHLARFVEESPLEAEDVVSILRDHNVDVLVNLLPTGSIQATWFYACAALEAHCAFINCIPTMVAQQAGIQEQFTQQHLPLFGDDIKSQIGTTILHRTLLHMLAARGAHLNKTSQVNIGGNTDFANFVYRAETKLVSKRKSLARYVEGVESHVGHHYDPTKGALKNAFIEIEASVFGGSPVKISVRLESDDKPNSAGSVVDLVRLARNALDQHIGGSIPEVCSFYMKSPPTEMDDFQALELILQKWVNVSVSAST